MATQDWRVGNQICQILSSSGQKVVSLSYLCSETRAQPSEVRAALRKLGELGCPISHGREGYLLEPDAQLLEMDELTRNLRPGLVRWAITYFFYINSTQSAVRAMAERDAHEGTTVLAEMQSRGVGRLGRNWSSPYCGIWLSSLLRPRRTLENQLLTIAASLAITRAVSAVCGIKSELKWPNDVQIGGRKVAGVLGTSEYRGERLRSVAVGLGINANIDLNLLPGSFRDQATSLKAELGAKVDREQLIASALNNLSSLYAKLERAEEDEIVDEARKNCSTLGRRIQVRMGSRLLKGVAQDLDRDGSLILEVEEGRTVRLYSHDVSLLP